MTNPLYTISTLPQTSQDAIREFDDRYIASVGAAPPPSWSDLGDFFPTGAPMVTFPISNLSLKYQRTEGESRFKTLAGKSFDVKVEEFDAGVMASLLDLTTKAFEFRNWTLAPQRLMMQEARHRNKSIVTLLEAGASTLWGSSLGNSAGIDGVNFFSASHLSDFNDAGSTTWSNYSSGGSALTVANLKTEVTAMQGVLDENGDKLGVDPDTILVPTALYEPTKFLLAQNLMLENGTGSAGVTNPYTGKFNVVHVPEFTDVNDWYLVDSKMLKSSGLPPWISMRYTVGNPALELRHWDESSDFFKDTGHIKISSHVWYGFALAFPQAIRRVVGA